MNYEDLQEARKKLIPDLKSIGSWPIYTFVTANGESYKAPAVDNASIKETAPRLKGVVKVLRGKRVVWEEK